MRYSIRTALLTIALFAIVFSVAAVTTRDYRNRLRIESDLRSMGAYYVSFDDHSHPDWVAFSTPVSSPQIAKYKTIKSIDFARAHVTDASIQNIARLERIEMIHLTHCDITDSQLDLLAKVGSLGILRLNHTTVTDESIPAIASINDLISVDLSDTLVTDDGVAQLKERCPGITIRHEPQ
ncbi:MAG: hypothetical protein H6822_00025 [Planctomycetaceae bacterium]|nr:hypothetical protein [Planctomycetaceae bacterium]